MSDRMTELEAENERLRRRLESLAGECERKRDDADRAITRAVEFKDTTDEWFQIGQRNALRAVSIRLRQILRFPVSR